MFLTGKEFIEFRSLKTGFGRDFGMVLIEDIDVDRALKKAEPVVLMSNLVALQIPSKPWGTALYQAYKTNKLISMRKITK